MMEELQMEAAKLAEKFDAVQIMVSYTEDGRTRLMVAGSGNWYARQGMARAFINSDVAEEHAFQLAIKMPRTDL